MDTDNIESLLEQAYNPNKIVKFDADIIETVQTAVLAQFVSENGDVAGPPMELPLSLPKEKLQLIITTLLQKEEYTPYKFFIHDLEILEDLRTAVDPITLSSEKIVKILYQPEAIFRVRAVTRCSSSLPGHTEAILHTSFSPNGRYLASGSGDTTVRLWDVSTETPHFVCKGHRNWILATAWSTDGDRLASGCKSGNVCIWNPKDGKQMGKTLTGHKKWITCLAWEPLHLISNGECIRLASASKDGDIRLWNVKLSTVERVFSGHTMSVSALRWGGQGLIYSGSQDRTIKVWRSNDGVLCRTLLGHGHWVNTLALNTDYVLRTGASDPRKLMDGDTHVPQSERCKAAKERYENVIKIGQKERLVSGSDDFTLFLWEPDVSKKPITRMVGHQQLVNCVKFSPDTRILASASFDKSIRLWNGFNGSFIATLRGHVSCVYQLAWSADCRLIVSGSKDSTLKVWNVATKSMELELPGHADEVYAVDWSTDGNMVVSGGKDKVLKIWRQ